MDIVPSGWGGEFDEEDGIIRIVQPPNLQVIRIDIWYDSDKEAKESTNVQEYDDSEIIVWNKGNNVKAASLETPQLNSEKQIAKKPPPSVNHVMHKEGSTSLL